VAAWYRLPHEQRTDRRTTQVRNEGSSVIRIIDRFESIINAALLIMMAVVVLLKTVDLGWTIVKDIAAPPVFLLEVSALLDLFAAFLLVLIGVELLDTVKVYITDKTVHVELILSVGLVAIARKVILLDVKHLDGLSLIGIGVIIIALAASYYLVRTVHRDGSPHD
jgi:uncharacterized membrane protein (DUF373 family)